MEAKFGQLVYTMEPKQPNFKDYFLSAKVYTMETELSDLKKSLFYTRSDCLDRLAFLTSLTGGNIKKSKIIKKNTSHVV